MVTMKSFSLLIKPAGADCNLHCTYCFYLDRSALYPESVRHRMSDEVLERVIQSFMSTDQRQYDFGWQGGEPTLMGLAFFRKVTELQQKHGQPGAIVANGLQTNAILFTDEFAEHLAEYRFLVGVSLDGPAPIHDANRKSKNGTGSHTLAMRGIAHLLRRGVAVNILTLVNRSSVDKPARIYRYLRDHGFMYHQYIECVEFDGRCTLMPFAISGEEWGRFLCGVFDEWIRSDTRRVSVRLFDGILAVLVNGATHECQMGRDCRQYLVIEHNGDVYPCDFYVERDLRLGNVMTHTWEEMLASPSYEAFGKRKAAWAVACESCPYLRFCAGDCPKNRPGRGRDARRLSTLCEGWKLFYRHALPDLERLAEEVRAQRSSKSLAPRSWIAPGEARGPRAQRNDPCPCGSGRKYKRCCGA